MNVRPTCLKWMHNMVGSKKQITVNLLYSCKNNKILFDIDNGLKLRKQLLSA